MPINLYATFHVIAGVRSLNIDLPVGITARQMVACVLDQLPVLRLHWVNEKGEIHAHVHGFINGQEIPTLPLGWNTPLQAADILDFIPPVAGG
ncbi:MAG: MoaD/ThiS family protein [Bellilinea sp.]